MHVDDLPEAPKTCSEHIYKDGWSHPCGRPAVDDTKLCKLHTTVERKRQERMSEYRAKWERDEADREEMKQVCERLAKVGIEAFPTKGGVTIYDTTHLLEVLDAR